MVVLLFCKHENREGENSIYFCFDLDTRFSRYLCRGMISHIIDNPIMGQKFQIENPKFKLVTYFFPCTDILFKYRCKKNKGSLAVLSFQLIRTRLILTL